MDSTKDLATVEQLTPERNGALHEVSQSLTQLTPDFKRNGHNGHANSVLLERKSPERKARLIDPLEAQHGVLRYAIGNMERMGDLVENKIGPEHFHDPLSRRIADTLWERYARENGDFSRAAIDEKLAADESHHEARIELLRIFEIPPKVEPDFKDCVHTILNCKPNAPKFQILSADAITNRPAAVPIVDGILYADTTAQLVGNSASYKSFQGIGISEAVAGGHDWQGHKTRKMPTVYVSAEGAAGLGQRIKALQIRHQRPCKAQFILQAVQIHKPEDVDELLVAIAQLPEKPGLIVLDTLARCFVGGDENSAKDAGLFIAGLDRIRQATGATVVIVHHNNRTGTSRGSSAFEGAMDTIIQASKNHTTISLKCMKQKDAAEFETFSLVLRVVDLGESDAMGRPLTSLIFEPTSAPASGLAALMGGADAFPQGDAKTALSLLENQFPDGATYTEWKSACEDADISETTFKRIRASLMNFGQVTQSPSLKRYFSAAKQGSESEES
jgi:hypothetical protein